MGENSSKFYHRQNRRWKGFESVPFPFLSPLVSGEIKILFMQKGTTSVLCTNELKVWIWSQRYASDWRGCDGSCQHNPGSVLPNEFTFVRSIIFPAPDTSWLFNKQILLSQLKGRLQVNKMSKHLKKFEPNIFSQRFKIILFDPTSVSLWSSKDKKSQWTSPPQQMFPSRFSLFALEPD